MTSSQTQRLRNHMQHWLKDWPDGLSSEWQQIIGDVMPDFNSIRCCSIINSDQCVYPRRYPHSCDIQDAPDGSHIFHALNNLSPASTRVVFIGQDPYTTTSRATGRSFEAGDKDTWDQVGRITSLRRICQQLAATRTDDQCYQRANSWQSLKKKIADETVSMRRLSQHFDDWERQGVLLLNQSLTATTRLRSGDHPHLSDHLSDHLNMWKPVVSTICSYLARCRQPVFVLLGSRARSAFSDLRNIPPDTYTVCRYHPAFTAGERKVPFLVGKNLFDEINEKLLQSHNSTICW